MWTLANILTGFRLVAAAPTAALVLAGAPVSALALFALAAATDFFDGWLARARGEVSTFGAWLDPLADKALSLAALAALMWDGTVAGPHLAAAWIIILRELLVAGARFYMDRRAEAGAAPQVAIPVSPLSKLKTATLLVALALLMAAPLAPGAAGPGLILLWVAAGQAVVSGFGYWRAAQREAA
ncbi:MAG: CDP-alcohol phosphatidyltransferase family protein [Pseudomonadota bacterium]